MDHQSRTSYRTAGISSVVALVTGFGGGLYTAHLGSQQSVTESVRTACVETLQSLTSARVEYERLINDPHLTFKGWDAGVKRARSYFLHAQQQSGRWQVFEADPSDITKPMNELISTHESMASISDIERLLSEDGRIWKDTIKDKATELGKLETPQLELDQACRASGGLPPRRR